MKVPTWNVPGVFRLRERKRFDEQQFVNDHLFDGDGFYGRVLYVLKGQGVPEHVHEHFDESFDILEGVGTFWVNGEAVEAGPGTTLYIPAGTYHGFLANVSEEWVIRETVHHRVYARRALRLLGRALLKRLPFVGHRWR